MGETIKAFKGFKKTADGTLRCKDFIFKEGETYTHDGDVELCKSGFHACEAPIDCLNYYDPNNSEYHEVEMIDVSDEKGDDTKRVSKSIKIGAKIDIPHICKAQFEFVSNKCEPANSATGDWSANSATGYGSANSATGDWSANSATGNRSANSATGYGSANSATGYGSANVSTGNYCKNEGGEATLNAAWGRNGKCKGDVGAYLVLTEWSEWDGKKYPLIGAKMVRIDGKRYKPDMWYTLKGGKVVEADDD